MDGSELHNVQNRNLQSSYTLAYQYACAVTNNQLDGEGKIKTGYTRQWSSRVREENMRVAATKTTNAEEPQWFPLRYATKMKGGKPSRDHVKYFAVAVGGMPNERQRKSFSEIQEIIQLEIGRNDNEQPRMRCVHAVNIFPSMSGDLLGTIQAKGEFRSDTRFLKKFGLEPKDVLQMAACKVIQDGKMINGKSMSQLRWESKALGIQCDALDPTHKAAAIAHATEHQTNRRKSNKDITGGIRRNSQTKTTFPLTTVTKTQEAGSSSSFSVSSSVSAAAHPEQPAGTLIDQQNTLFWSVSCAKCAYFPYRIKPLLTLAPFEFTILSVS